MSTPNVYARVQKISDVVNRSSYLTDSKRQEEIVLHKEQMQHSWKEHADYEQAHKKSESANNEAREVHIALPKLIKQ